MLVASIGVPTFDGKTRSYGRFGPGQELASWTISNPDYNKLNKVKKTSPEAFYYYYRALERMRLV
jgi:hypothetical protein